MFGLSFLYPAFLVGLLAAAVPVLLHLRRRQAAPPVRFPAMRFLRRARTEETRRQRLRELLLLALRVVALLLLAAAFARPYMSDGATAAGGVTVVAVDTSFSLSSPGRFDRARALARDAIDAAPDGDEVAVVAFSDEATVAAPPAVARGPALAAVAALEPGFGATRYQAALDRAEALIGGRRGQIVLVSDLQRTGWRAEAEGAVRETTALVVRDVGGLPSNLAVVDLARAGDRARAVVVNGGAGARQGRARLFIDGRETEGQDFEVGPGGRVDVTFDASLPSSGAARVVVDDPTGFAADDERYLVLDPPAPLGVLIVTARAEQAREAFYVERALGADTDGSRFRTTVTTAAGLTDGNGPVELDGLDVVLLLATRGLDRRAGRALAAFVERGGGALVAAGSEVEPAVAATLFGTDAPLSIGPTRQPSSASLVPVDARHPVFRPLGPLAGAIGAVRFARVATIGEDGWQAIARFSDGAAALAERRVGAGRIVVFASDLAHEWNDFPTHPAFAPFLHEVVGYLAGRRRAPSALLVADVPPGVAAEPGIARAGRPLRAVAINVDPLESDPAHVTAEEFAAAVRRVDRRAAQRAEVTAREIEAGQSYWRYGLVLMLAVLVTEGLVGRRG